MPWGLLLLTGGGFALAKATKISGLSHLLAEKLVVLHLLPRESLVLVISVAVATATEFTSNPATASIVLPVLGDLVRCSLQTLTMLFGLPLYFDQQQAFSLELNPLYLMIPATLSCSFAFMMPVATPPNAIVYSTSGMRVTDMVGNALKF